MEVRMKCDKNGNSMKLCPFSLGLALGLTAALGTVVWTVWVMYAGPTAMMTLFGIPVPTLQEGLMRALWMLLKGFAFGVVFGFLYDWVACCCRGMCCKKSKTK